MQNAFNAMPGAYWIPKPCKYCTNKGLQLQKLVEVQIGKYLSGVLKFSFQCGGWGWTLNFIFTIVLRVSTHEALRPFCLLSNLHVWHLQVCFFFVCVLFFDECVFAPWAHDDTMNYLDIAFGNGSRLRLKTLLPCGPISNNLERIGHISVGCHLFR